MLRREASIWVRQDSVVSIRACGIHSPWISFPFLLPNMRGSYPLERLVGSSSKNCVWPNSMVSNLEQHLFCGFGIITIWVPHQYIKWTQSNILPHVNSGMEAMAICTFNNIWCSSYWAKTSLGGLCWACVGNDTFHILQWEIGSTDFRYTRRHRHAFFINKHLGVGGIVMKNLQNSAGGWGVDDQRNNNHWLYVVFWK